MSWESQMPVLLRNRSAESQIDRLLDGALHAVNEWSESWDPDCSILEDQDGFTVQMALPGIEPGRIDAQVEHAVLRVKGERKSETSEQRHWYTRNIPEGVFSCSFTLPAYVDHEKPRASCRDGILTITFPKRVEAKPHRIMIEC